MFGFLKKIFTNHSERTLKATEPYIAKIKEAQEKLLSLSDDQLREQTQLLKKELKAKTSQEYNQMLELRKQAEESNNITEKTALFAKADQVQKKYDKKIEQLLLEILPQAFAIVKETTRRFKENKLLQVQATAYDQELAQHNKYITIQGQKASWSNTWQAGGQAITWDMIPYDVQLIGGIVLHQGKVAEMATGEGKTLVATLPAYLNALTGQGVHVITVNDYLAKRDAAWVGPIYQFHGLTVDCIDLHTPHSPQRKQAYLADITYGTNNEFIFDYLRDNLATRAEEQVQKKLNFCICDEADYMWIDDARTPCIISGQATYSNIQAFYQLQPRVQKLYQAQRELISKFLEKSKELIKNNKTKEAGIYLFRIYRGLPKYEPFMHYLSEKGIKKLLAETENIFLEENNKKMPEADEPLYFIIEEKYNTIQLTEKGAEYLTKENENPNFFVLPDVATQIAQIEHDTSLTDEEKITKREELTQTYGERSARIDTVRQLLKAYALFKKDIDYVVMNRQVKIVDEKTGRILIGRRYSGGLHQAIEAKEKVDVQEPSQTYATITPQNYFRMYPKISGMTGTIITEAKEIWDIYNCEIVVIPTHKPIIRKDKNDKIYKTKEEKLDAIVQEIKALHEKGRPVLVGTPSVKGSEEIDEALAPLKIADKQVLNAKNHQKESKIVARAGQKGAVTIATPMAGRGTDIKLSDEAKALGGLAIIGVERHESRRVDRQLRGRAGRQGDPGSSQFFISLDGELMGHFRHGPMGDIMDKAFDKKGEAIEDKRLTRAIESAQKRLEQNAFAYRKRELERDDVLNMHRNVIYKKRKHALHQERIQLDIMQMLYHTITDLVEKAKLQEENYKKFQLDIIATLGIPPNITPRELIDLSKKKLIARLYQQAYTTYLEEKQKQQTQLHQLIAKVVKNNPNTPTLLPFGITLDPTDSTKGIHTLINTKETLTSQGKAAIKAIESSIILYIIDQHWKMHLQRMDALKEATRNAVYEQKDPLLIYKFEGLELFKQLITTINKDAITHLFKLKKSTDSLKEGTPDYSQAIQQKLQEHKASYASSAEETKSEPIRSTRVANRNERVTVQYTDGTIKENVKFKKIEQDLKNKRCTLIQN